MSTYVGLERVAWYIAYLMIRHPCIYIITNDLSLKLIYIIMLGLIHYSR